MKYMLLLSIQRTCIKVYCFGALNLKTFNDYYSLFTASPEISIYRSSGDVVVKEGASTVLTCKAEGHPTPMITWKREDGKPIRGKLNGMCFNVFQRHTCMNNSCQLT